MSVRRESFDWKSLEGAFEKPRRLHLKCDKDGHFHCPVPNCEHNSYSSQRGCRKHAKTIHPWFIYFDTKPISVKRDEVEPSVIEHPSSDTKPTIPCCDVNSKLGRSLSAWLQCTTGGGKQAKQGKISVRRAFKFLKYCCDQSGEDEHSLLSTHELVDYFPNTSQTFSTIWKTLGKWANLVALTTLLELRTSWIIVDFIRLRDRYLKIFLSLKCTLSERDSVWQNRSDLTGQRT